MFPFANIKLLLDYTDVFEQSFLLYLYRKLGKFSFYRRIYRVSLW